MKMCVNIYHTYTHTKQSYSIQHHAIRQTINASHVGIKQIIHSYHPYDCIDYISCVVSLSVFHLRTSKIFPSVRFEYSFIDLLINKQQFIYPVYTEKPSIPRRDKTTTMELKWHDNLQFYRIHQFFVCSFSIVLCWAK